MSEINTKTFAGIKQTARGMTIAMTISLAASFAAYADGDLSLKNVTSDASKRLVVQFAAGGGAPQAPKLMVMPSPNHQLLIDFTGVSLDDNTVPSGDQLSKQLAAQMPGVRAARVGVLANAAAPTVRVALDLDPDLEIKPSITSLQDGAVIISLGENYGTSAGAANGAPSAADAVASASAPSSSPSAATDPAAAYEEYYRKFLQQKQINAQEPKGEWGPRKGTADEAKGIKNGFRIIGTPVNSPALADIPKTTEEAPAAPAKRRAAPVAAAVPAVEAQPAAAEAAQPAETAAAPAAPAAEAAPAAPTAEAAPTPGAQVAEAAPETRAEAAAAKQEAPAAKEEAPAQAQPDMVAGGEAAAETSAPPVAASAAVTESARAPQPGRAAAEEPGESAASPGDAVAAAAGNAGVVTRSRKEQDQPENQPHVTSPVEDAVPGETPRRKARRLFNDAVTNHLHGHSDQAIALYKAAIKVDPELGDAHSNLGLAYNQQHNYASALSEFHKALAVNPRDAITYNGVGAALRAENDMPGAIKNWETAVKIDPTLAVAHYNLGTAYEHEEDYDRALVSYQEAVKNDPHLGEAYFRMGLIMQKKHRLQDAKAHYKQALKVSADSDYAAEAKAKIAAIDKLAK